MKERYQRNQSPGSDSDAKSKNEDMNFDHSPELRDKDMAAMSPELNQAGEKTPQQITESQIKKMNKEAKLLGQTLTLMLERFQSFEKKLKEMEREQTRQRSINEHLLHQLIKSKDKEAIFTNVMNVVLNFFQQKRSWNASEDPKISDKGSNVSKSNTNNRHASVPSNSAQAVGYQAQNKKVVEIQDQSRLFSNLKKEFS